MKWVLTYLAVEDLETSLNALSMNTVMAASVALLVLLGAAVAFNKKYPKIKLPLFVMIVLIVTGTTLVMTGATVYLNVKSAAGGPVHWHADFELWACGNELNLRNPQGLLSNKIGTPTLHEHNDKRIHLEGVPVTLPEDASLGKFMSVVGGEVGKGVMVIPLNEEKLFEETAPAPELVQPFIHTQADGKVAKFVSGQNCGDQKAEVQVFAYRFDEASKTYAQTKVDDPARFAISPHGQVPPGDCVIMEFGPKTDRTTHLCKQYGIRDKERCEQFGVKAAERKVCENVETRDTDYNQPKTELEKRCRDEAGSPNQGISADCAKLQGVY